MTVKPAILLEQANRDIEEAIDYYLAEGGGEAGPGFIEALEQAVRHIEHHPATGSPRYAHELNLPGLKSWPLRRFPYMVFYVEQADRLDVWRVLHAERDVPSWMREPEGG